MFQRKKTQPEKETKPFSMRPVFFRIHDSQKNTTIPNAQCMVHLPTFTRQTTQFCR